MAEPWQLHAMGWTPPPYGTTVPGLRIGPDLSTNQGKEPMSRVQIGVDLAKSVFEVAVSGMPWQVRPRLSRAGFGRYVAAHPPAENLSDARGSAQIWTCQLQGMPRSVLEQRFRPARCLRHNEDGVR